METASSFLMIGGILTASSLFAVAIGRYDVQNVEVPDGEATALSGEFRFAAQSDGVAKTGGGTVTLNTGAIVSAEPVKINVHEGNLALNATAGGQESVTPPSVIAEKAALWLQAGVNVVPSPSDATRIESWFDVREPQATRVLNTNDGQYPMARAMGVVNPVTNDFPSVVQIQTGTGMRDAMYFRGKSYSWMRFHAKNHSDEANITCYHTFAVVFPQTYWGYLYGTMGDPLFAEPGDLNNLLATGIYFDLSGTLAIASARFHVDGKLLDPGQESVRKFLQVQEMEFDHRPATWDCLFRNAGNGRYGGDYVGEVIVFTRHLGTEELLAVSSYLRAKWLGQPAAAMVELGVAREASAEVNADGTMSVSGEGTVKHTGDGTLVVKPARDAGSGVAYAQAMGTGRVQAEVGEMRVRPEPGERLSVGVNDYDAHVLGVSAADGAYKVALEGAGTVRVEGVPAGVSTLEAANRELVLGGASPDCDTIAVGNIYATIRNGDGEERFVENPGADGVDHFVPAGGSASDVDAGWHYETTGGFSFLKVADALGTWKFNLNSSDDRDRFASPQGVGCISLKMQTTAWTELVVPKDGDYDFSYFATARRGHDGGFLCISICDSSDRLVHEICCHPILLGDGWRRYRYLVRDVKAGEYRLKLALDCQGGDKSAHVDDLKMRLVSVPADADRRCQVPNGGFNCISGTVAKATIFSSSNLPKDWTLAQGSVGGAVASDQAANNLDVALAMRWHKHDKNTKALYGGYFNPSARYGEAQLHFRSNGGAADSSEFTVPAGRWKVCVNAGNWTFRGGADVASNINYLSSRWNGTYGVAGYQHVYPKCGASVFINGTEQDLGATVPIQSYTMADYAISNSFTVAEGDVVKIRLRQSTSAAVMMAVNEVWLERADDGNLVSNGSFELGDPNNQYYGVTDWTLEKHVDLSANSNAHRFDPYNPTVQGTTRCSGTWALLLVNAASAKQDIVFPKAGTYRLKFYSRARFKDNGSGTVDNWTHGGNRVRAWLQDAHGNETPILQTPDVYSTNFLAHAALFSVPSAGVYTLNLNGCNLYPSSPTGRTAGSERVVYIDDVSVTAVNETDARPADLNDNLAITVADGTRLRLDYVGTNRVGSVRIGGVSAVGVIDASHPSGLVTGPGALCVQPGATVIFVH